MIVFAVAGAWLASLTGNSQVSSGLTSQRQAATQAGLVLSLDEIPRRNVPAEDDASAALAEIRARWSDLEESVDREFWPAARALIEGSTSRPSLAAFEKAKHRLKGLFTLLDGVASRSDLTPSWGGGKPLRPSETLLPMAAETLLVADFRYAVAVADWPSAGEAARRAVRIARLIAREETPSAIIQAARLESAVLLAWADSVRTHPSDATLGIVRGLRDGRGRLDEIEIPSIRRVLTIEAARGAREIRETPRPGTSAVQDSPPEWYSVLEARYWMTWRGVIRQLPDDRLDLAPVKRILEHEGDAVRGTGVLYRMAFERTSMQWVPMVEAVGLLAADRALVEAFAGLISRKLGKQGFPDSLADLGLEPRDPFAQGPIRFRQVDGGFVVYSVGPDLMNDGGESVPVSVGGRSRQDRILRFP